MHKLTVANKEKTDTLLQQSSKIVKSVYTLNKFSKT